MTTAEKLAKLKSQIDLACSMVEASDPKAAGAEKRAIAELIQRITSDMTQGRYDQAARAARGLSAAVLNLQAAWARGESSATGRALTQVEKLATDIEAELREKTARG